MKNVNRKNLNFDTHPISKLILKFEIHFLKQWRLIKLVIPTTDNVPQEGLLMWDSDYLMRNFMLISWTDQSVFSRHASLNNLLVFLPMGICCTCFTYLWIHRHFSTLIYSNSFPLGINIVPEVFEVCVLTINTIAWHLKVRLSERIYRAQKLIKTLSIVKILFCLLAMSVHIKKSAEYFQNKGRKKMPKKSSTVCKKHEFISIYVGYYVVDKAMQSTVWLWRRIE